MITIPAKIIEFFLGTFWAKLFIVLIALIVIVVLIHGIYIYFFAPDLKDVTQNKTTDTPKTKEIDTPKDNSISDELNKLNQLHKEGILSDGEFKKAKEKLLR